MSDLLTSLRTRFPNARFEHAPDPACNRCGGTGVRPPRVLTTGGRLREGPCPCLFFGTNTDLAMGLLKKAAKSVLEDLRDG